MFLPLCRELTTGATSRLRTNEPASFPGNMPGLPLVAPLLLGAATCLAFIFQEEISELTFSVLAITTFQRKAALLLWAQNENDGHQNSLQE